ncbi:MAG: 50S ribosomal protein L11 methyltransferase [Bacteroidetes bacterium]|nr:50S ribosomal protein L11 methyltransferase [Bacteroidota bacterium]
MNYVEVAVTVEPKQEGSDVLIATLSEFAFESFTETETGFNAYIKEEEYSEEEVALALGDFDDIYKIQFVAKTIPQQNWNKEWESSFQPIDVVGKCYIRAPFHEKKEGYALDVIIEPKMSFGTGHHDTTQLMIQVLMLLNVKNKSLMDMGCGTGVLAIVASKLGANPIEAVDIDDWSVENSIENLAKNNINNVLVHKGDAQILEGKIFHTILANINKNVLLKDMDQFKKSLEKGGNLLLSGFFETDIEELKAHAGKVGLKYEERYISNQWAALHFTN